MHAGQRGQFGPQGRNRRLGPDFVRAERTDYRAKRTRVAVGTRGGAHDLTDDVTGLGPIRELDMVLGRSVTITGDRSV